MVAGAVARSRPVRAHTHTFAHMHTSSRRTRAHDRCISFALWARPLSLDRREAERSSAEPLGTGDCRLCLEEHALSAAAAAAAAGIFCNLRLPSDFQIGSAAGRPVGDFFARRTPPSPSVRPCSSAYAFRRSILASRDAGGTVAWCRYDDDRLARGRPDRYYRAVPRDSREDVPERIITRHEPGRGKMLSMLIGVFNFTTLS